MEAVGECVCRMIGAFVCSLQKSLIKLESLDLLIVTDLKTFWGAWKLAKYGNTVAILATLGIKKIKDCFCYFSVCQVVHIHQRPPRTQYLLLLHQICYNCTSLKPTIFIKIVIPDSLLFKPQLYFKLLLGIFYAYKSHIFFFIYFYVYALFIFCLSVAALTDYIWQCCYPGSWRLILLRQRLSEVNQLLYSVDNCGGQSALDYCEIQQMVSQFGGKNGINLAKVQNNQQLINTEALASVSWYRL